MTAPLVIVAEPLDPQALAWLGERVRIGHDLRDGALAEAVGLVVRTYTRVDAALLARAPKLRVVARAGVGVDNIDLRACAALDVVVVHTPEANTDAVVEFTIACVLDALRPRVRVERAWTAREWSSWRDGLIAERQLAGSTLGVLGLGRIGSRVARVAGALRMRVLYHDLLEIPAAVAGEAQPVGLDDLLRAADVVTIHVDGRPENRGLIGARELGLLAAHAALINTSRGFVVDARALAGHLRRHPQACAALDVHEPEPPPADHPLLGLPNAFLTPHIAAATRDAKRSMSWVVTDLWRVLEGEQPRYRAV